VDAAANESPLFASSDIHVARQPRRLKAAMPHNPGSPLIGAASAKNGKVVASAFSLSIGRPFISLLAGVSHS
jgi:hypothetical protein